MTDIGKFENVAKSLVCSNTRQTEHFENYISHKR